MYYATNIQRLEKYADDSHIFLDFKQILPLR